MVTGYFGELGAGKTYLMVYEAMMRVMEDRAEVATNMQGLVFPQGVLCDVPDELHMLIKCVVLSDEAGLLMDARKWSQLPEQANDMLTQSRKRAVDFCYSCPDFSHVDSKLRTITHEAVICRPFGPWVVFNRFNPQTKEKKGKGFVRMRNEVFKLYDSFEEQKKRSGLFLGSAGAGAYKLTGDAKRRRAGGRSRVALTPEKPVNDMYWRGSQLIRTPEAVEARAWLLEHGLLLPGHSNERETILAELKRRQWLGLFGLEADNVPLDCSPSSPWMPRFGVDDREERRDKRELREAHEAAMKEALAKERKRQIAELAKRQAAQELQRGLYVA